MPYDSDDDDRPRRRRTRNKRRRSSNVGMWVALAGLALVLVVAVVVAVVIARKNRGDGPDDARKSGGGGLDDAAKLLTARPGARAITLDEFKAITKEDTLASLEARFGPAKRLGTAELDGMYLNMMNRGRDVRLKISFGTRLRGTYKLANPECYLWKGGGTSVYVVPAEGHPTANLRVKFYNHEGTDEKGEFHGETHTIDLLNDGVLPSPLPPGK